MCGRNKQEEAFQTSKNKLVSEPVLRLFNHVAHTELHCDASCSGLSGMLLQKGSDGKMHLIHAVSKKTTAKESMYQSTKLESMAEIWSVNRLRNVLIGIHFIIITDCQATIHLNTKITQNPQIARWAIM